MESAADTNLYVTVCHTTQLSGSLLVSHTKTGVAIVRVEAA